MLNSRCRDVVVPSFRIQQSSIRISSRIHQSEFLTYARPGRPKSRGRKRRLDKNVSNQSSGRSSGSGLFRITFPAGMASGYRSENTASITAARPRRNRSKASSPTSHSLRFIGTATGKTAARRKPDYSRIWRRVQGEGEIPARRCAVKHHFALDCPNSSVLFVVSTSA